MSRSRRCACQGYGSHGGYGDVRALGFTFVGEDKREAAAKKQVQAALSGQRLSGYLAAEGASLFQATPTSEVEAYVTAAYWMAVAARVLGSSSLAQSADSTLLKRWWAFGFLSKPEAISAILSDASKTIRSAAGAKVSDASVQGVLAQLGDQSAAEAIRAARASEASESWVPELVLRSGEAGPGSALRSGWFLAIGDRPPEVPAWKWALIRGGMALGAIALVGGVLYIYTAPMRRAARAARGG